MIVKVDNREAELISRIKYYKEISPIYKDIEIVVENLPLADIIISKNGEDILLIERKSLSDLSASIKDGRYEEQSYRLNGSPFFNHNIIYLIEGDMTHINQFKDRTDKTTLYSAMFSLNYFKGFSVFRSVSLDETAIIICNMAYKLLKSSDKTAFYSNSVLTSHTSSTTSSSSGENNITLQEATATATDYCNVVKKVKKENVTEENISEIMLCQIPGISSVTAIAIMKEYKTINNLIIKLNENKDCLKNISYTNAKGQTRKIGKNVIDNIVLYLSKK
jgi:ERCC4-type nuclease